MFSKFEFCGYLNLWVFKICGYSNLWVHKICDDTKFQVSGREYQNICVLCISCEQKNICAFFHICFLPYVQNIPCEPPPPPRPRKISTKYHNRTQLPNRVIYREVAGAREASRQESLQFSRALFNRVTIHSQFIRFTHQIVTDLKNTQTV